MAFTHPARARRFRLFAAAVVGALMLAACGGADEEAPAEPEAPADSGESSTSEPSEDSGDAAESEGPDTDFYDGQTLTIVSPGAPGGGQDSSARFIAPWLEQYLDGDVTVVVDTKGGPAIGFVNEYYEQTERNGLFLLQGSGTVHTAWRFGDPGVRYALNEFETVMSVPTGGVWFASPDTGIETPADLIETDTDLFAALISPTGGDGARLFMLKEILGVDVHPTFGYEGRAPALIAFEQGEANIDTQTTTSYLNDVIPMIEAGEAIPLFSYGQLRGSEVVRDPTFPDLPTFVEVHEEIYGEKPSGTAWDVMRMQLAVINSMSRTMWIHGDAPQGAFDALDAAFEKMVADPAFVEEAAAQYGGYEVMYGPDVRDLVRSNLFDVEQETIDWFAEYIFDEYGVELD